MIQVLSVEQLKYFENLILESRLNIESINRLMINHQSDLMHVLQQTQNFTVYSTIPCMFNSRLANNFSSYKVEDIQSINQQLLRIQFNRYRDFLDFHNAPAFFANVSAVSLLLYYDQMKAGILSFLMEGLTNTDLNFQQYALVYSDILLNKIFDLKNQDDYRGRFSQYIEDLLKVFINPLLNICIENILNFQQPESIEVLNTIMNLEDKKDFSKDAWVIHEYLKGFVTPKDIYKGIWVKVLNQDLGKVIVMNFLNPKVNQKCFNIISSLIFIIKRYFPDSQILITQIIGFINEYLNGILSEIFPISEEFTFYLRYMMVSDIYVVEQAPEFLQFTKLMFLISEKYLSNKVTDNNKNIQLNIFDFWSAYIINIRGQNFTDESISEPLLNMIYNYFINNQEIILNKQFRNDFKTLTHLWYDKFIDKNITPLLNQQYEIFKRGYAEQSLEYMRPFYFSMKLYLNSLFGSIRASQFEYYILCQYQSNSQLTQKPFQNHNEMINIIRLNNPEYQQKLYNSFAQNLNICLRLVEELQANFSDSPFSKLIISEFWHKYAKYIILNKKQYLNITQIFLIIYGQNYEQIIRNQQSSFIAHISALLHNLLDKDSMVYTLKSVEMLSKLIPPKSSMIEIGLFKWNQAVLHPLFHQLPLMKSFDQKYKDLQRIYQALGRILKNTKYSPQDTENEQDNVKYVSLIVQPLLQQQVSLDNLYPLLQQLQGIQANVDSSYDGEYFFECIKQMKILPVCYGNLKQLFYQKDSNVLNSIMKFLANLTHYDARQRSQGKQIFEFVCSFIHELTGLMYNINIENLTQEQIYKKITKNARFYAEIFVNIHEFDFFNQVLISKIPDLKRQITHFCNCLLFMVNILPIEEVSKNFKKMKIFERAIFILIQKYIDFIPHLGNESLQFKVMGKILGFLYVGVQNDYKNDYNSINMLLEKVIKQNTQEIKYLYRLVIENQDVQINLFKQKKVLIRFIDLVLIRLFLYLQRNEDLFKILFSFLKINPQIIQQRLTEHIPLQSEQILQVINLIFTTQLSLNAQSFQLIQNQFVKAMQKAMINV